MQVEDTETLVALVLSLMANHKPSQATILDALVQANGNVDNAVKLLYQNHPTASKKRNNSQTRTLDGWLSTKRPKCGDKVTPGMATSASSTVLSKPESEKGARPKTDLMSVLQQPAPGSSKKTLPRLAPLVLSSPDLVKKHTPCTLHLSILPQELACKLFYTMLDASTTWKRNKWWLFDRVVESPHKTSFYARGGLGNEGETWHEAAQYWYEIVPATLNPVALLNSPQVQRKNDRSSIHFPTCHGRGMPVCGACGQ